MCRFWLAVCAAPVLLASFLFAQAPAGEIHLEIKDPAGASVIASGKLEGRNPPVERTFQTDAAGRANLDNLPLGSYRIEVSKTGFVTQSLPVEIPAPTSISVSVTLSLSAQASKIDVVATTPLAGSDLPLEVIPAPVQTITSHDLTETGALDLSDLLNRKLSGVNINNNQENPFQPDVNYRGYTASPLLGTPQGVSVYMDGVRLNQPFGDVVSWDLIPRIAISEVALVPGSNPLFGLNTLGGALSVETKDGNSKPGSIQVSGGSFGRRAIEAEYGGMSNKGWNWYLAGNLFHDDGWRVNSPSDVRQGFSKVGWQGAKTALALSFAYADNKLIGNGLQEQRLLARNYASAYTLGDVTANRSPFVNLSVRQSVTPAVTVSANAYFRYIRADTVNTNLNNDSLDESVYQPSAADQAALLAAGYTGFPASGANASNTPFPFWRCIAQTLQLAEPIEKCNGLLVRGFTKQNNYGLSGQSTWTTRPGGRRNQLTFGAAWDRSGLSFVQSTQFAYLNPDYTLTPVGAFEDGSTNRNGDPLDARVNLHGIPQTWSLYATDTFSASSKLSFTVSGRYNRTTIDNQDRIDPGGGPGSLDGHSVFSRLNPSFGATFSPVRYVNAYASYSEGSRAPTTIELGCADPNNPCNLPNALASDPPLRQVVTRTVEAGLRAAQETRIRWSIGWYRAQNRNDVLFVASPQTGNGYFKNFGETRRTGVEAHLGGKIGRLNLDGNYTFVDATYQSPETVDGSSNSTNDSVITGAPGFDGVILIQPGDRIPLIPRHIFKGTADLQATRKLSLDLDFTAVSSSFARGNENNLSQPDGVYYLGPGVSPGYGVVDFDARYQLHKRVQVFVQIDNVLDHRYYTAAQLAPTGFTAQGAFIARPLPAVNGNFPLVHATFYAPGAPVGAWGGVRVSF